MTSRPEGVDLAAQSLEDQLRMAARWFNKLDAHLAAEESMSNALADALAAVADAYACLADCLDPALLMADDALARHERARRVK